MSKDQGGWDYDDFDGVAEKKNRRQRWRRISLAIMLISFCILVLLGYHNHTQAEQDPKFCLNCHVMRDTYISWQQSSHSKVDCLKCHKDVSIAGYLYKQFMGVDQLNQVKVTIDDSTCQKCHTDARVVTPPTDLIVPHNLHMQMGLSCTQCHQTVTHGKIINSSPSVTQTMNSTQSGDKLIDPNRIPMSACMKCHNGAMATNACNACHDDKIPPSSHTSSNFAANHGYVALNNVASCNNCHQYDTALQVQYKPEGQGWTEVQNFARKTEFCLDCHRKRPASHGSFYTVSHGPAATADINRCLTCHNQNDNTKLTEKPATSITCAQCHYNQHPANFLQVHPTQVNKDNQSKCFGCHDASSCNDCHNKTFRAKQ